MSSWWLRRVLLRPGNVRRLFYPHRACTTTTTGAVQPKPYRPIGGLLGVVKVGVISAPFIYAGAMAAAQFAAFLEESDIFVPDDDDDD